MSPSLIVNHPDGNDEWHYSTTSYANSQAYLTTGVVSYQGTTSGSVTNPTGTMLKKVETTSIYNDSIIIGSNPEISATDSSGNPVLLPGTSYRIQYPGAQVKRVITLYDPVTQSVQSSQESDSTPVASTGSVLWIDPSNYWYPQSGTCACLNYTEVAASKDYDVVQGSGSGPGTLLRQTTTDYRFQDSGGSAYASAGLIGLPSSVTTLDGNNNQAAQQTYSYDESAYSAGAIAGELTTTQRWAGGTNWLASHAKFNSSGVFAGSIDPMGTATSVTAYDCSGAFPSAVTMAAGTSLAENHTYAHDCNTGAVISHTDPNSQTSTYSYADALNRVTAVHHPDGGSTQVTYTDGSNSAVNLQIATGGSQGALSQTVLYDLLGRTVDVQTAAPGGTIHQTTVYDPMGRVWQRSNPYVSTSDPTYGITTTAYDGLGRTHSVSNPDSTSRLYSYNGEVTTFTDERNISQSSTSDGLGRLVGVTEASGATTAYSYDALGNLKQVNQAGVAGDTARTRSFTYDSLSRLLTSNNPETGTICYGQWSGSNCVNGYDANGNLSLKTDARGVATTYIYDVLNRLTRKTYSDGSLPAAFGYDGKDVNGGVLGVANAVGHMSNSSNTVNIATVYSFDTMGRTVLEEVCVPTDCSFNKHVSATYDLAGNLTSMTYPDGRVVQQGYDSVGHMNSVGYASWDGTAVNQSYFTANTTDGYDAAGHLLSGNYGNGVALGAAYDNRERVQALSYGPSNGPLWSKQYGWTANSNLQSQTDLITGVQRQFNYDSLNRLTAAQDIFTNLAVPSASNGWTSSTSTSGSGVLSSAGASGAAPWLTNPDDSNLLSEIGANGWNYASAAVTLNAVSAPDGSMTAATLNASSGSADSYITGSVSSPQLYDGETVSGSVWLRSTSGTMSLNLYVIDNSPSGWFIAASKPVQLTTSWQQFQLSGSVQSNLSTLLLQIGGAGTFTGGQTIQIWNPMLEDAGTAGGTVTNYLPNSQNPAGSGWMMSYVSLAANTGPAPDGTNTASTFTTHSSNTNDVWIIDQTANPAAYVQQPITMSIYARADSPFTTNLQAVEAYNGSYTI